MTALKRWTVMHWQVVKHGMRIYFTVYYLNG